MVTKEEAAKYGKDVFVGVAIIAIFLIMITAGAGTVIWYYTSTFVKWAAFKWVGEYKLSLLKERIIKLFRRVKEKVVKHLGYWDGY